MNENRSDHSGVNIFDQIDSICSEFREEWKRGGRPSIEGCLDGINQDARSNLFRNLLQIDTQFRRRSGDQPTSAEYIQQFPQFRPLIRQAFFEDTLMSIDGTPGMGVSSSAHRLTRTIGGRRSGDTSVDELAGVAASRLGDYHLEQVLGRGAFGVVYLACHAQTGNVVALKTLPSGQTDPSNHFADAERLHKFRREFRSLAEINHPNLVGMQTLEVDGNQWFFTMDLIDGEDFLSYVRPAKQIDLKRLRRTLPQLASGIMSLHAQHILHRDLKPNNVLVDKSGRLVILDFGLIVELDQRADVTLSRSQHFAGTPAYAAPEQIFGQRTAASDWYAMGVMIFEALTGRPPFLGSSAGDLLFKKQNEPAPKLSGREDIPEDLAQLADGLLQTDPTVRPDSLEIARFMSMELDSQGSHESRDSQTHSFSSSSEGPLLIGRDQQLAQLEQCRQQLLEKRIPQTVLITGRSGEGKTSLAESFLVPLRRGNEMLVLSGRCYDRESVPFKAIDSWIDALVNFLRSRQSNELKKMLPKEIPFLAHLFPVIRRVEAIAQIPAGRIAELDSKQIRNRAFDALKELLCRLSQNTPIIIFVDDLQWGDADSAVVLSEIMLSDNPPALLMIGSFRSDEAEESPFLNTWNQNSFDVKSTNVSVGPLSRDQCVELVVLRIGVDNESIRGTGEELYQNTGGNPYFLDQLIECFDPETGLFTPLPLNEVIDRRLDRLPAEAGKLLQVIAVSGQAISMSEASLAAGDEQAAVATMMHMRSERLVRLIGSEAQQTVDTYHDKIRETVIEQLPAEDRRQLHLNIAETIERREALSGAALLKSIDEEQLVGDPAPIFVPRVFDLAYHFNEAADQRAFVYQLLAGEEALRAYAHEEANLNLSNASQCISDKASPLASYRLFFGLAKAQLALRKSGEALKCCEKAIDVARTRYSRAKAYYTIAYARLSHGQFGQATEMFDFALDQLVRHRPKSMVGSFASSLISIFRILLIPAKWQRLSRPQQISHAGLEHWIYTARGQYSFETNVLTNLRDTMYQCVCAIRTGMPEHESAGLGLAGTGFINMNMLWLGKSCLARAMRLSQGIDDLNISMHHRFFQGSINGAIGNIHEGVREFRIAIDLAKQTSNSNSSLPMMFMNQWLLFTSSSCVELQSALDVLKVGYETDNARGIYWGHLALANAFARKGDLAQAKTHVRECTQLAEDAEFQLSILVGRCADCFVLAQSSDYKAAEKQGAIVWQGIRKMLLFSKDTIRMLTLLIEVMAGPRWTNGLSTSNRSKLIQLCRSAARFAWWIPPIRPHALRVRGRAYFAMGRKRKGIRCLERSVETGRKFELGYDLARSLLDLAAVKEEGREENRREAVEKLRQLESVIPYAEHWMLGDEPDMTVVAPPPDATETDAIVSRTNLVKP